MDSLVKSYSTLHLNNNLKNNDYDSFNGLYFLSADNERYGQVAFGGVAEKYHDMAIEMSFMSNITAFTNFQMVSQQAGLFIRTITLLMQMNTFS